MQQQRTERERKLGGIMKNTKFVFTVSILAMLTVCGAWANAPEAGNSDIGTAHSVFTELSPTDPKTEDGKIAGIAGVTYVNRAVNKAGAAAIAAEAHAAAAGAYAVSAKSSAETADSKAVAAKSAADAAQAAAAAAATAAETAAAKALDDAKTYSDGKLTTALASYSTTSQMNTALAGKQASLSTAQLSAVNSGITAGKVTTYDGYAATIAAKANSGDLAKVATSGSYNDLANKPTIPSGALASKSTISNADVANDAAIAQSKISGLTDALAGKANAADIKSGKLTLLADDTEIVSFNANNAGDVSKKIIVNDVPVEAERTIVAPSFDYTTKLIDEANTSIGDLAADLADLTKTVKDNKTAADNALAGKQASLTATQLNAVNSGITAGKVTTYDGYAATIAAKANSGDLAKVATSGSYNDLANKPTIPSGALASKSTISNADVANDAAIAQSKISGLTDALAGKVATAQGSGAANKAVITDSSGNITTGTIATGMIEAGAVTVAKTSGLYGVIPMGGQGDTSASASIWVQ